MSLIGIDIGTSGCKVVIFNRYGEILGKEYKEHPLLYPKEGWVEIDPDLIWSNIKNLLIETNQKVKKDKVQAFSISSHGETIIPVDKNGDKLSNAIVSFDNRTKQQHDFWEESFGKKHIFRITGMPLHPMYSINKVMWIKQNLKDVYKRTFKFLCFEDYIFMKLGLNPTIDFSLAARTMAFDVNKKKWSEIILQEAGVDVSLFSDAKPSGEIIGGINSKVLKELGLGTDVIGVTGGHDQACGALGSGVIDQNVAVNTTGTCDVITTVLDKVNLSDNMLKNNYPCYPFVNEGKYMTISFNLTGGLLLKWYVDNFCHEEKMNAIREDRDIYEVIISKMYSKPVNIFILPHLAGSGTPYLDVKSKGVILGLDLETDKSKLSRAILESTAYDLRLNLEKLKESGITINKINAAGGGAKSFKWLQIKSDILNKKIVALNNPEAACLGAAMLAGIAIGEFKSFKNAVENTVKGNKVFIPDNNKRKQYKERFQIYKDIYIKNRELLHRISRLNKVGGRPSC